MVVFGFENFTGYYGEFIPNIDHQDSANLYKVVKESYYSNGRLLRVLIQTDSVTIRSKILMQKVVCSLNKKYPLKDGISYSFFSDVKHADYFSDLIDVDMELDDPRIEDLRKFQFQYFEEFYIGELSDNSLVLKIYPKSITKVSEFQLEACE